ncbi:MAG: ABC transporter ATP-binding protein [Chloroflexi bacterium]|nr:ABC transporter ATP-binding protein [Chloroflexota bacterium]
MMFHGPPTIERRNGSGPEIQTTHVIRPLLRLLAPLWVMAAVAIASICIFALANLARPIVIQQAIDDGIIKGDGDAIVVASIWFFALGIVIYVVQAISTYTVTWVGQQVLRNLRMRLFSHYQRLSMSFFDKEHSGRLVARMTADMNALSDVLNSGFLMIVQALLLLLGAIVILFLLSWQLSLVSLAILPPLIIATMIFRVYSERAYDAVRDRIADVMIHMQENFAGMRVVQAFARERQNAEHFDRINEHNYEANLRTVRISSMYIPFIEWLGGAGIGIILYFGAGAVFGVDVSVGTIVAFIFYINFIFQPIQQLSQVYDMMQSGFSALKKIFGLLEIEPEVVEPKTPATLSLPVRGQIDLDDLSFGYSKDIPVIKDVNIEIASGQRLVLVGPTGAGKSTLAKLMMRFYDPTMGRILLDGQDIRQFSFKDLRRSIIMVPQEGFLFSGTIRENILFGRPDATDDEVVAACQSLGVHSFIEALPDGYDTAVSYRGSRLSAGEKQVVSISRAFLADPPVLILDEATSSMDPGTEAIVEGAIRRALEGRTSIVIAHRLSTAEQAQRILVVNDGRVIEDGSHAELVSAGGYYTSLYERWIEHGNAAGG